METKKQILFRTKTDTWIQLIQVGNQEMTNPIGFAYVSKTSTLTEGEAMDLIVIRNECTDEDHKKQNYYRNYNYVAGRSGNNNKRWLSSPLESFNSAIQVAGGDLNTNYWIYKKVIKT